MKVSENEKCAGCPMLKVDCTYEKGGKKIHHVGADQTFVAPTLGPSLRIIVGEAPGESENLEGRPFVGAAGHFLDALLRKAGIQRDQLTTANVLCCRPPNNKFPGDSDSKFYVSHEDADRAIKHCIKAHLLPLLKSRPWTRVDLLGVKALYWLTGLKDISKWRGSPLDVDTDALERRIK